MLDSTAALELHAGELLQQLLPVLAGVRFSAFAPAQGAQEHGNAGRGVAQPAACVGHHRQLLHATAPLRQVKLRREKLGALLLTGALLQQLQRQPVRQPGRAFHIQFPQRSSGVKPQLLQHFRCPSGIAGNTDQVRLERARQRLGQRLPGERQVAGFIQILIFDSHISNHAIPTDKSIKVHAVAPSTC